MVHATKDQQRRNRVREYDATLAAARVPVAVMVLFVRARELRSGGVALEEAFAATKVNGTEAALPPAVWVALRQGDIDTTIEALVRGARENFLIAEHEELDAGYKLTTIEELRGLADVELLQAQLAAFLQIPRDVIAVIAAWGPDDPRTAAEIDTLIEQRFGSPAAPVAVRATRTAALTMTSTEFAAILNLTPAQRGVLTTLVRQSEICIAAG